MQQPAALFGATICPTACGTNCLASCETNGLNAHGTRDTTSLITCCPQRYIPANVGLGLPTTAQDHPGRYASAISPGHDRDARQRTLRRTRQPLRSFVIVEHLMRKNEEPFPPGVIGEPAMLLAMPLNQVKKRGAGGLVGVIGHHNLLFSWVESRGSDKI